MIPSADSTDPADVIRSADMIKPTDVIHPADLTHSTDKTGLAGVELVLPDAVPRSELPRNLSSTPSPKNASMPH